MTHYYTYDGLKLVREEWGNNTIIFLYDASASIGNAMKKGGHPMVKKTARATLRQAWKSIKKSATSSLFCDLAYGVIDDFASRYTNTVIDRAFGR